MTDSIHVSYELTNDQLPLECIKDCSGPGPVDEAVAYWRRKLKFTVDRENALRCLQGYGAWQREELADTDDETLAERILCLACCYFDEWDGTDESLYGSDVFVLE